jgi:hypothetical protein
MEYFFTKMFLGGAINVDSDSVRMIAIEASTTPGQANVRNGKAKLITSKGASEKYFAMFRYFTEMPLEADALRALREFDSPAMQQKGRQIVEIAQQESKIRADLFKEIVTANIMTYGRVNFDASGNILVPTVHATTGVITDHANTVISADFGVADAHRGDLGGLITGLFSTAATKIPDILESIQVDAADNGRPEPRHIYINRKKKALLRNNTQFNDWAKYNSVRVDEVLNGDGIQNLWGWDWHFVSGKWTDYGGTSRELLPLTSAIITPDDGPWRRAFSGSELIDTTNLVTNDLLAALNQLTTVYGPFSYAETRRNPAGLSYFQGDNFGMGFADPGCVYMPTVFA